MPLLNANNLPRKRILPWRLKALRESALNGCCPKEKILVCVLEEGKIWRGRERNRSMGACPIEPTLVFLSFLFFSFLFSFLSFSFLLALFFPFTLQNMLCFRSPSTRHGKSLFIVPAATKVLPFYPLTASVWSGRTCRPPEMCATHPCQTEASFSSALP